MKTPLLIVLTAVVFGVGSALVIMNNSCKSSHHAWCAPTSDIRQHAKHPRRNAADGSELRQTAGTIAQVAVL